MESTNSCLVFLRVDGRDRRQGRPASKVQEERAAQPMEAICCRACGGVVTGKNQKIQVNGSHTHTFFNPAGIVFELGCFHEAPGCQVVGWPSAEFTWFPGHTWRVALCRHCRMHLGWLFTMQDNSFQALILSKLRE
jgi:hypothetical protein